MPTEPSLHASPGDYERTCLEEVRVCLQQVLAYPKEPRELRELRLDGEYPETRIVIVFWDRAARRERRYSYELWSDRSGFNLGGGRHESPKAAGLLIATWAMGG